MKITTNTSIIKNIITLLIITIIINANINEVKAQITLTCQQFDVASAPITGPSCAPYVDDQVVIPPTITQGYIDQFLNDTFLYEILAVRPIVPRICFENLVSLLCNSAFPPCNQTYFPEYSLSIGVGKMPCKSVCEQINYLCYDFFSLFQQPPINCSMENPIYGGDMWPDTHTSISYSFVTVNSTCYPYEELPQSSGISSNSTECPYPTVAVENPTSEDPPCGVPCPDPTWTPKQWSSLAHVEFSFALIAFLLMFFLSLHYIVDPKCRNTTKRFQLYAFLSQMMWSFSFVLGGTNPEKNVWCKNSTTFADWSDPACGAQAFFFVVFGLTSAIWWAISSAIMYTQLEKRHYRVTRKLELLYHGIAVGIPIIFLIVAVQQEVVTFYWITPFCFIQYLIPDTQLDYHYVLFYIPMCIPMMVAMGYIVATIAKIVKHTSYMRETFKDKKSGGASLIKVNIRLLVWCGTLFLFFFTIIIYRAILEDKWRPLQDDATEWGICKVMYELGLGSNELCPEKSYPRSIDYPGTIVHYIIATSIGTLSFLAFGTNTNLYIFWYYMYLLAIAGKWTELHQLITNEKAFNRMKNKKRRESTQVKLDSLEGITKSQDITSTTQSKNDSSYGDSGENVDSGKSTTTVEFSSETQNTCSELL